MTKTKQKIYPIDFLKTKKQMWNVLNNQSGEVHLGTITGILDGYLYSEDNFGEDIIMLKGPLTLLRDDNEIILSKVLILPRTVGDLTTKLKLMTHELNKIKNVGYNNKIHYKLTIHAQHCFNSFNEYTFMYQLEFKIVKQEIIF